MGPAPGFSGCGAVCFSLFGGRSLWLYFCYAQQQEGTDLTAGWSPWQQLTSQPVWDDSRATSLKLPWSKSWTWWDL